MSNDKSFLVTGATGTVGTATTKSLLAMGRRVVAAVRNPDKGRAHFADALAAYPKRLTFIPLDFDGSAPPRELFAGVDGTFLMRPPQIGEVESLIFPFLRAAADAAPGADAASGPVVFLSLLGAEWMPFLPHRKIEKEIERLGLRHTFMRAGFFMQNLDTVFRDFIREMDELPLPAGKSKTSFVDARDLGEAAALLLGSGAEAPPAVKLTGEERQTYQDVGRALSRELGREISYTAPRRKEFERRALEAGWEPGYVTVVSRLFMTVRLGLAGKVTDTLRGILRRPPRRLQEYIRDYREAWLR